MGEYIYDQDGKNQVCKAGTCEDWRYIRRDEAMVLRNRGYQYHEWNWVFSQNREGPIFRFPDPKEDASMEPEAIIERIGNRSMFTEWHVSVPPVFWSHIEHKDYWQPMYYGENKKRHAGNHKTVCPLADPLSNWSSGGPYAPLVIVGERMASFGLYTIFACPFCNQWFGLDLKELEGVDFPPEWQYQIMPFQPQIVLSVE